MVRVARKEYSHLAGTSFPRISSYLAPTLFISRRSIAKINLVDEPIMQSEHFDLNDIQHEPTDEQLKMLMNAVAAEANRRAELARVALMERLRDDIVAANHSRSVA